MKKLFISLICAISVSSIYAQQVDYSVVQVPEEAGIEFRKITQESDYVAMPQVIRGKNDISWYTNRILDVSAEGTKIGYISFRNNATNVFVKDIEQQGSSVQRTNRTSIGDFSFSPDGKYIVFSEQRGDDKQIFQTDAKSGYVCRQITSGAMDYTPAYSADMKQIFFCRQETYGTSIWGYDLESRFLSSFFTGMNPCPLANETSIIVSRTNNEGRNEIWKINYSTGVEECIVSSPKHSYTSPIISPDGKWILFVGDGHIPYGSGEYINTDLFVCKLDGSDLTQLTFHAADDISPIWSRDGKYIYFVSQRGDAKGIANVWRMDFKSE